MVFVDRFPINNKAWNETFKTFSNLKQYNNILETFTYTN